MIKFVTVVAGLAVALAALYGVVYVGQHVEPGTVDYNPLAWAFLTLGLAGLVSTAHDDKVESLLTFFRHAG
ncbi:MAG: hypothetical protein V4436_02710 [Patescibacteria group bacterium]